MNHNTNNINNEKKYDRKFLPICAIKNKHIKQLNPQNPRFLPSRQHPTLPIELPTESKADQHIYIPTHINIPIAPYRQHHQWHWEKHTKRK